MNSTLNFIKSENSSNSHYDPTVGRWTTKDPIGFLGGDTNLYSYVNGNPMSAIDPLGLWTINVGININLNLGFGNVNTSIGIAVDDKGNVGTYTASGGGVNAGTSSGAGLSLGFSNANTIYDLAGTFANTSFSAGEGLGGTLDLFSGHNQDGSEINGAGITGGLQLGLAGTLGATYTTINPLNKRKPATAGGKTPCP